MVYSKITLCYIGHCSRAILNNITPKSTLQKRPKQNTQTLLKTLHAIDDIYAQTTSIVPNVATIFSGNIQKQPLSPPKPIAPIKLKKVNFYLFFVFSFSFVVTNATTTTPPSPTPCNFDSFFLLLLFLVNLEDLYHTHRNSRTTKTHYYLLTFFTFAIVLAEPAKWYTEPYQCDRLNPI